VKPVERELRGVHVLLILLGAFGVIILANLALTVAAVRSFPGMEVRNSYVASQQFEERRLRQEHLGWQSSATYDGSTLAVAVRTANGMPAELARFSAKVVRPTHQRSDIMPGYRFDGTSYVAPMDLAPGYWNIHVSAESLDGFKFEQKLTLWASPNLQ